MWGNGNPKSGDKGSNFAWEKAVIVLLNRIVAVAGGTPISSVRTPGMVRTTGVSVITAGKRAFSVLNAGAANGTVMGVVLEPGEIVSFSAGLADTFGAVTCNGTGTELLITTVA